MIIGNVRSTPHGVGAWNRICPRPLRPAEKFLGTTYCELDNEFTELSSAGCSALIKSAACHPGVSPPGVPVS